MTVQPRADGSDFTLEALRRWMFQIIKRNIIEIEEFKEAPGTDSSPLKTGFVMIHRGSKKKRNDC